MAAVLRLKIVNHFGDCPKCRRNDGHINIGREHWFFCKRHRVKWKAGHDIFPDWRNEDMHIWRQNERLLDFFTEVEPLETWRKTLLEEAFASSRTAAPFPRKADPRSAADAPTETHGHLCCTRLRQT